MSVDNLKEALPEYAKDLKLNLGSITRTTVLDEEQLWGTLLSCAAATRNPRCSPRSGRRPPTPCRPRPTAPPSARRRSWG